MTNLSVFRALGALVVMAGLAASTAQGGVIFNFTGSTLGGGSRWDAAPREINLLERSLDGGLRYSVQGGSFEEFFKNFSWQKDETPSLAAFETAVGQAFNAWTVTDPVSKLPGMVSFKQDLGTSVVGGFDGAEIDLFATDLMDDGTRGFAQFSTVTDTVTLTSGTKNYAGSSAIVGADITINSNSGALYTLDLFRRLLTHEIGHTIGLGDVEGSINPGAFIDDNFDGTSSATALATLTNSWAHLVDPLNPGASSKLARFTVPFADPGTTTTGVDILMESNGVGIGATNPITNLEPLTNDDYGTRQFLYPSNETASVPEPSTLLTVGVATLSALGYTWRRRKRAFQDSPAA